MPAYVPFAGKNSIVEATFGLQFAQPIVPQISEKFGVLQSELIGEFPSFEKMQMLQLTVGTPLQWGTTAQPTPTVGGFNASKFKTDGKPSRTLRGMNNFLSAHFLEYETWAETKADALRFFARCTELLNVPSALNPIATISLRFIDRFTFDGDPETASASQLFKSSTKYIPPSILSAGNIWQSNSAWFDNLLGGQKCLHQLNIQGAKEADTAVVILNHNINCNLDAPLTTMRENSGERTLENVFDAQHKANVDVLKNMLDEKMQKDIGLIG